MAFSQNTLNTDGNVYTAPPNAQYTDYAIPNSTEKPYLYLSALGADGGKREFKFITTCTKEAGQGAHSGAWYKIGNDGLLPGGTLRFVFGKKGEEATGNGTTGAGGGGGTAVLYHPPTGGDWTILMVAGGGGGAASDGLCSGGKGLPGQAGSNGADGAGLFLGKGGQDGGGGKHGAHGGGGGGWRYPGAGKCDEVNLRSYDHDISGQLSIAFYGGGMSGSGKATLAYNDVTYDHWSGGYGGSGEDMLDGCTEGNYHAGGYGFGGGGSGHGSGGGGGGYSGGGGGGAVGPGLGGGGGGGSFINPTFAQPFVISQEQRGTTSSPSDGSIQYQFAATLPIATRDLYFECHKGTEVQVLKAGDWTLLWQYDGNLVLYGPGFPNGAWASNTAGTDLFFQGDGNLVIYQANAGPWSSDTADDHHNGKGGRKLVLTQEGGLYITDQDGKVIWTGH